MNTFSNRDLTGIHTYIHTFQPGTLVLFDCFVQNVTSRDYPAGQSFLQSQVLVKNQKPNDPANIEPLTFDPTAQRQLNDRFKFFVVLLQTSGPGVPPPKRIDAKKQAPEIDHPPYW